MWWPLFMAYARKYWRTATIGAAVLLMLAVVGYIQHLRHEARDAKISQFNAEAARDSLTVKYRDDSIAVVGILGFTRTELAGLREQLKLAGTTKTETRVTVTAKPVHVEHPSEPVLRDFGDTLAVFEDSVVGPPADVRASVLLIAKPDSSMFASWVWDVQPSPIALTVNVGCLEQYKPQVLVGASPWVRVDSVATEVRTEVCGEKDKQHHSFGYYALRTGIIATAYGLGRAHVP